jgi:isochorismate synthase
MLVKFFKYEPSKNQIEVYEKSELNGKEELIISDFEGNSFNYQVKCRCIDWEHLKEELNNYKEILIDEKVINLPDYQFIVRKGVEDIRNGKYQKIVLSRFKRIEKSINLEATFKNICQKFSNFYCYILIDNELGIWCGASPETLVQVSNKKAFTVSLAGTKKNDDSIEFTEKEQHEQGLVTDFIIHHLKTKGYNSKLGESEILQYGNISHLYNKIEITEDINTSDAIGLAKILHPTPAVCGYPRNIALEYIKTYEAYERQLYAGFIGICNTQKNDATFFVNLRCFQVLKHGIRIYGGAGITIDSNPLKEYVETENKIESIQNNIVYEE